jgi:hypothetical protein
MITGNAEVLASVAIVSLSVLEEMKARMRGSRWLFSGHILGSGNVTGLEIQDAELCGVVVLGDLVSDFG